jgi:hypothetical protein
LTVAEHKRARARKIAQGVQSALGFSFLKNGNGENDDHRERQNQRLAHIAENEINDGACDQQ